MEVYREPSAWRLEWRRFDFVIFNCISPSVAGVPVKNRLRDLRAEKGWSQEIWRTNLASPANR